MSRPRAGKVSDAVVDHIETLILEGVYAPGDRLPSERELAMTLDVSRPSVREALNRLAHAGLIEVQQGGGSYVRDVLGATFTDPLARLIDAHPDSAIDFVEFRRAMEGICAYYAALRGTEADHALLTKRFKEMEDAQLAGDAEAAGTADAAFHLAIAEAAHNVVVLHVMRGLFDILKTGVLANRHRLYRRKGAEGVLLRQHQLLYDAILAGDPEEARKAAHTHLTYVQESLREMERDEYRQAIAEARLERQGVKAGA